MKRIETSVAIILVLIACLGLLNEYIQGKINDTYESQIKDEIILSNLYNETNALQLEYINLLIRNQTIALDNKWNVTLENSNQFNPNTFSEQKEWKYWKDKKIGEYWEYCHNIAYERLYESFDKLNIERKNREILDPSNNYLSTIKSLLWIGQLLMTLIAIFLYYKLIKNI
jgi:hypothetical protein